MIFKKEAAKKVEKYLTAKVNPSALVNGLPKGTFYGSDSVNPKDVWSFLVPRELGVGYGRYLII